MKNIFKKSILFLNLLLIIGACDTVEIVNLNPDANTTVSLDNSSLVLTEDIAENVVLTITWTDPDFGFDAAPRYEVLMDVEGGDFTAPQIIPVGSNLSKTLKGSELNDKLLLFGLIPFEPANIYFKVKTILSPSR